MSDESLYIDGTKYDSPAAATVALHPDIPQELKKIYITGAPEPVQASEAPEATQVPAPENNAPAGSAAPSRGILDKLLGTTGERYKTWPEKMFVSAWDALKAPGDAYAGKLDEQQMIERAADLAGVMVMGPAPVAKGLVDGTLGSFAGVKSKGFDLNKKAMAQIMESNGKDADKIFLDTGMFRGVDGRWRYEIPDKPAKIDTNALKPIEGPEYAGYSMSGLTDYLDHPELYKAYPQLKKTHVFVDPNTKNYASWDSVNNALVLSPKAVGDKPTVMHEVQHAIQDIEGFAKGGAARSVEEGIPDEIHNLRYHMSGEQLDAIRKGINNLIGKHKQGEQLSDTDLDNLGWWGRILDTHAKYINAANKEANENYLNLAGEVEARNVDYRTEIDPKLLKFMTPKSTEDTARSVQAVVNEPVWTTAYGAKTGAGKEIPLPRSAMNDNVSLADFEKSLRSKTAEKLSIDMDAIITKARDEKRSLSEIERFKVQKLLDAFNAERK